MLNLKICLNVLFPSKFMLFTIVVLTIHVFILENSVSEVRLSSCKKTSDCKLLYDQAFELGIDFVASENFLQILFVKVISIILCNFILDTNSTNLKLLAKTAQSPGGPWKRFDNLVPDVCSRESGNSHLCPLEAGNKYTYKNRVVIDRSVPAVSLKCAQKSNLLFIIFLCIFY